MQQTYLSLLRQHTVLVHVDELGGSRLRRYSSYELWFYGGRCSVSLRQNSCTPTNDLGCYNNSAWNKHPAPGRGAFRGDTEVTRESSGVPYACLMAC